jgi:8-amino-7-oxononanoate synthase
LSSVTAITNKPNVSSSYDLLHARIQKRLHTLYTTGLDRTITDLEFLDPVTARDRQGVLYTVFSSNNYLGLTHHPKVRLASIKATLTGGTSSTGSRLITGGVVAASTLEKELAAFKGMEEVLLFNTGYMANLGVLYALLKKGDLVFSDELNHASIIEGCRISKAEVVVYKHNDMEDLKSKLEAHKDGTNHLRLIVTDGVFSMDGDLCRLPELVELKRHYGCLLMVDDAHAEGVIGPYGKGTEAYYGLSGTIDLQTGTLSKSLASEGGYVAARQEIITYLKNRSRPFIFSTFISPSDTAAAHAALTILKTEGPSLLKKLHHNTAYVRKELKDAKIPVLPGFTPLVPIMVGSVRRAAAIDQRLKKEGILLSAIRPPSVPMGKARLRLTVTAAHTVAQIRAVIQSLTTAWSEIK